MHTKIHTLIIGLRAEMFTKHVISLFLLSLAL